MFYSRIIITATVVLFGVYTYSGVSGQDATQATTVKLEETKGLPQPQVGNQTSFRHRLFRYFHQFMRPFRRFFRCRFRHHSHPLIPAGTNGTEWVEELRPFYEAPVNKTGNSTQSPCCWFNRTDVFGQFFGGQLGWRKHLLFPPYICLPVWRWHKFGGTVDSVDVSTTPAA